MDEDKHLIETMERLSGEKIVGDTGDAVFAILPSGKTVESLQPYIDALRDNPKRIVGNAALTTVPALIDYLNRFKTPDTALFAIDEPSKPSLLGVIDFHGQGPAAAPQFGVHRVSYPFPISDQIKAWSGISGKPLSHEEFASFIQERQYDIANPPLDWMQVDAKTLELVLHLLNISDDNGSQDEALDNPGAGVTARDRRNATVDRSDDESVDDRYIPRSALYKLRAIRFGSAERLIQLARTVELSINSVASEGYNPKTGERTIKFTEEHQTHDKEGRRVTVPDAFLLRAPVWEGETPQLIPVRVQYRRKGGALLWHLVLVEWRRVVRFAVKTEAERVCDATKVPLFFGTPA